ncbi:hypothetical protein LG201_08975 [Methylobacillus gramineus]|uniref:BPSS1780 family membrane protein n=1 Tax=Methylobacillus gramineus TaxID=755169 RepID=UPI001CFFC46B|nr:BPSS1780 family membrane protein [Methylobacillus gramineus]MCB5185336.1 hypothetical protein [Methylobacillus gramineus]
MQVKPSISHQTLAWLRDILALFRKTPGKWMLLGLAHVFFFAILPGLLGLKFVSFLLLPAFLALAVGFYRDADQGRDSDLGDLLNEIKPHFLKLLSLGAICVVYVLLINLLTVDDSVRLAELTKSDASQEEIVEQVMPLMIKLMLLLVPLVLVIWFAPALVSFQQYSVVRAIKSSLAAFIQYFLPLLLTWLGVTLTIMMSMTLAGILVGTLSAASTALGGFLMLILVFGCMLLASALMLAFQYVSNRDIFKMPPPVAPEVEVL